MISVEAAKYLWDARQAADRIVRFTAGRDFAAYLADDLLRSAVERQFEIMGEALNCLRRLDPTTAEAVPDLGQAIAFRNVLIHGYATVNHRLVWSVIESDLGRMRAALVALVDSAP